MERLVGLRVALLVRGVAGVHDPQCVAVAGGDHVEVLARELALLAQEIGEDDDREPRLLRPARRQVAGRDLAAGSLRMNSSRPATCFFWAASVVCAKTRASASTRTLTPAPRIAR
jgi:hypothetical protein